MPFYNSQGTIPLKRHTVFSKDNNTGIYYEEHISREGFSNIYSNIYHIHMPTQLKEVLPLTPYLSENDIYRVVNTIMEIDKNYN